MAELKNRYFQKFNLAPTYNEEEFVHWFMPREGVVTTYVVENNNCLQCSTWPLQGAAQSTKNKGCLYV